MSFIVLRLAFHIILVLSNNRMVLIAFVHSRHSGCDCGDYCWSGWLLCLWRIILLVSRIGGVVVNVSMHVHGVCLLSSFLNVL